MNWQHSNAQPLRKDESVHKPLVNLGHAAYTIVEMVIVVLIIGILAAVAAPRYTKALEHYQLEASVRRVIADLRFARSQAQRTSVEQKVIFDLADNSYRLVGVSNINRSSQNYEFHLGQKDYQSQLQSVDFGGSTTVDFNIYGLPHSEGTVVIQKGNSSRTITISKAGVVTTS